MFDTERFWCCIEPHNDYLIIGTLEEILNFDYRKWDLRYNYLIYAERINKKFDCLSKAGVTKYIKTDDDGKDLFTIVSCVLKHKEHLRERSEQDEFFSWENYFIEYVNDTTTEIEF